jgi:hypothetical protein
MKKEGFTNCEDSKMYIQGCSSDHFDYTMKGRIIEKEEQDSSIAAVG